MTLPGGLVLDETDDALGLLQVGWDGSTITGLFATLSIMEGVYGFAGGTLEFQAFGDGSLDFIVTSGIGSAVVSRFWWKFLSGVLRAGVAAPDQAAWSRVAISRG